MRTERIYSCSNRQRDVSREQRMMRGGGEQNRTNTKNGFLEVQPPSGLMLPIKTIK
jgi:hypothetical protein